MTIYCPPSMVGHAQNVVLEYHPESNRRRVDALLADYVLVGGQVRCPHRGVMKYVHRPYFPGYGSDGDVGSSATREPD